MRVTETACSFVGVDKSNSRKYFFLKTVKGFLYCDYDVIRRIYNAHMDGVAVKNIKVDKILELFEEVAKHASIVIKGATLEDLKTIICYGLEDDFVEVSFPETSNGGLVKGYIHAVIEGVKVMVQVRTGHMYTVPDVVEPWNSLNSYKSTVYEESGVHDCKIHKSEENTAFWDEHFRQGKVNPVESKSVLRRVTIQQAREAIVGDNTCNFCGSQLLTTGKCSKYDCVANNPELAVDDDEVKPHNLK